MTRDKMLQRFSERTHLSIGFLFGALAGSLAPLPWYGVLAIGGVLLAADVLSTRLDQRKVKR